MTASRQNHIRAEVTGSDTATALGITAKAPAAVLALCRALVDADYDPATPLNAYRGDMLCLRVRSIGEAADLEINGGGTGLIRRAKRRARPATCANAPAGSKGPNRPAARPWRRSRITSKLRAAR